MYRLSNPAIDAILKQWNLKEYDPPNTDIREWINDTGALCETYGIPETQRPECATRFIKKGLRTELEKVLKDARAQFGPVRWTQFTDFMVAFDRGWHLIDLSIRL